MSSLGYGTDVDGLSWARSIPCRKKYFPVLQPITPCFVDAWAYGEEARGLEKTRRGDTSDEGGQEGQRQGSVKKERPGERERDRRGADKRGKGQTDGPSFKAGPDFMPVRKRSEFDAARRTTRSGVSPRSKLLAEVAMRRVGPARSFRARGRFSTGSTCIYERG